MIQFITWASESGVPFVFSRILRLRGVLTKAAEPYIIQPPHEIRDLDRRRLISGRSLPRLSRSRQSGVLTRPLSNVLRRWDACQLKRDAAAGASRSRQLPLLLLRHTLH